VGVRMEAKGRRYGKKVLRWAEDSRNDVGIDYVVSDIPVCYTPSSLTMRLSDVCQGSVLFDIRVDGQ
jgi:hypothetical protein